MFALSPMTDLKFVFRHLLKSPGVTAEAVLTLASGIGPGSAFLEVNESSKHQTPNPKEAPNLKLQYTCRTAVIGIWCLGFLWSLVFGIWCFVLSPIAYRLYE